MDSPAGGEAHPGREPAPALPRRGGTTRVSRMQKWEYATVPLLSHATKQILDQWGEDGWELVAVLPGPTGEQMVAYMKRPKEG
ncbi:hypothetical protein GCM10027174_13480 [Salinifilum aidingensis]